MASKEFNLEHLADLANIKLNTSEKKELNEDLKDILSYVDKLQEKKEKNRNSPQTFIGLRNVERPDMPPSNFEVKNSQKKDIKEQAPDTRDNYFVIPQVLKR